MKTEKLNIRKKADDICISVFSFAYAGLLSVCPAFADETDEIISSIKDGLGKVYKILTAIVLPLAAIVIAITAVKMIGGSSRESEEGKNRIVRVLIALAVVYLAPLIISVASAIFSKYATQGNVF